MEKKMEKLVVCVLALAVLLAGSTAAHAEADIFWDGGGSENYWTTPENWVGDVLPTDDPVDQHCAVIDDPLVHQPLVEAGINASVHRIIVGLNNSPCTLTVTGGSITSAGYILIVGRASGGVGILDVSGGDVIANDGLLIGDLPGSTGTLNMSGGNITIETPYPEKNWHHFVVGGNGGLGTLNMSGGVINVDCNMQIPLGRTGVVNMTGGTIDITGKIILKGWKNSGEFHLDGGVVIAADLTKVTAEGCLDLAGGTMILDGNKESTIQGYIDNGFITGYHGNQGAVIVDYDFTTPGKTTIIGDSNFNVSPQVDAGDYQSLLWPDDSVQLDTTVSDDGRPYQDPPADPCTPVGLTLTWSKISGPGSVAFSDTAIEDPTATFSAPGTYQLELNAFDGEKSKSDTVGIVIRTDNKPIAHWDFDEGSGTTVNDDSANNNEGTLAGNKEPNWVSGWVGNGAMEFYGVGSTDISSYVDIVTDLLAPDPNLDNLQYDITLSGWFKIDDLANAYHPAIIASSNKGWRLYVETAAGDLYGKVTFTPGDTLSGSRAYSTRSMDDGYWHHVVGVYDCANSKSYLYVDGVLDTTEDNSGILAIYDVPVTIGARATSDIDVERSWNGMIDDIRVYSYAIPLTKAEGGDDSIEGLYDMGLPLCYGDFLDGDFNEDCYIDLLDFGVLSTDWMNGYSLDDLAAMAGNWLSCNHPLDPACI